MSEFSDVFLESQIETVLQLGINDKNGTIHLFGKYMAEDHNQNPVERWGEIIIIEGGNAYLQVGERQSGKLGKINISDHIVLDAAEPSLVMGNSSSTPGSIQIKDKYGNNRILLNGTNSTVSIGTNGSNGTLNVYSDDGQKTAQLYNDAQKAGLSLGGNGRHSSLLLIKEDNSATVRVDGKHGNLTLGGGGADGDLLVKDHAGETVGVLDGGSATLTLGHSTQHGGLEIRGNQGAVGLSLDPGTAVVGGAGMNGRVVVRNFQGTDTITLNGMTGLINTTNADVAEEFDVDPAQLAEAQPGVLMSLNLEGKLAPSSTPYDSKVVGVVAGAGAYKPAMILDKRGGNNRLPIAMMGKVYCQVTAENEPIQIGDLLTSSHLTGHAMRASDRGKAFGSVIGKALAGFSGPSGLIPVLVNLQ